MRTFYWWYLKFNSLMIMFLLRSWMDWWWNKSYKIQDSAGSHQLLITQNIQSQSIFTLTGYSPRQRCAGRHVQHWHCAEGRHWECSFEAYVPWLCEVHRWVSFTTLTCTQNTSASKSSIRRWSEGSSSRRRPLLGPSPGWKRLLPLSHLRHY